MHWATKHDSERSAEAQKQHTSSNESKIWDLLDLYLFKYTNTAPPKGSFKYLLWIISKALKPQKMLYMLPLRTKKIAELLEILVFFSYY